MRGRRFSSMKDNASLDLRPDKGFISENIFEGPWRLFTIKFVYSTLAFANGHGETQSQIGHKTLVS